MPETDSNQRKNDPMNMATRHTPGLGAVLFLLLLTGCGSGSSAGTATVQPPQALTAPVVTTSPARNGAVLVSISTATPGTTVYYSTDGSAPTQNSIAYVSPFLVASAQTVYAIAKAAGATSATSSLAITTTVPSGTLIWSDEFSNSSGLNAAPDSTVWQFDSMAGGFQTVNNELEVYCGWASQVAPCTATPNAYVGATDGYLHIAALQPVTGTYTSARIKTEGKFSMTYGRVEARLKLPEGQGFWPAFWLLGNNIGSVGWPACGEMDVMEHINAPVPDWIAGTLHMSGASGAAGPSTHYNVAASGWHVYGMIWSKGMVQYYVDAPTNIYATYQASAMPVGAVWPFDSGQASFIILNLAVGGSWPGAPDGSTTFPSELLVDYVRVYAN